MTDDKRFSDDATAVEPLAFSDDADENLCASSDYFWMLRTGFVEKHAREVWRSFRGGYATMGAHCRAETGDGPPTPPQRRLRAVA